MFFATNLIVVGSLSMLTSMSTAHAQFDEEVDEFMPHDLVSAGVVVGHLVVVGADPLHLPPGFEVGKEYWTWTSGPVWPAGFTIEPALGTPAHSCCTWDVFDGGGFDLATTVGFPDILVEPHDVFYEVRQDDGASMVPIAFMWLQGGGPLSWEWFGIAGNLNAELINAGDGLIEFVQMPEALAPDSMNIHPL